MRRAGFLLALLLAGAASSAGQVSLPAEVCVPVSVEERETAGAILEAAQPLVLAQDWSRSEVQLREAVRHDPGHAPALYILGQSLLAQGRPGEAVEAFERSREAYRCSLAGDPNQRKLEHERTAQIHQLRATLRALEREHAAQPMIKWQEVNATQPMPSRGRTMKAIREIEEKLQDLERARLGDDPAPPSVTYALGTALIQSGQSERAAVELRAAVSRDPDSGDAHHNLAVALVLLGEIDEAERAAGRAEELGVPISPWLNEEIARRK